MARLTRRANVQLFGAKEAEKKCLDPEGSREKHPAGAKAHTENEAFAARLKSGPVTKHSIILSRMGFSAACKACGDLGKLRHE
jgi:hypothetical protein